jgi:hypothetical protein
MVCPRHSWARWLYSPLSKVPLYSLRQVLNHQLRAVCFHCSNNFRNVSFGHGGALGSILLCVLQRCGKYGVNYCLWAFFSLCLKRRGWANWLLGFCVIESWESEDCRMRKLPNLINTFLIDTKRQGLRGKVVLWDQQWVHGTDLLECMSVLLLFLRAGARGPSLRQEREQSGFYFLVPVEWLENFVDSHWGHIKLTYCALA